MISKDRASIGSFGEHAAKAYLIKEGYLIVETNFRCRQGEIDIVAKDDGCLVFAEVKTRKNCRHGTPGEAVGALKQKKIVIAAQEYMMQNKIDCTVRFDVIELLYCNRANGYQITALNHIKDAFMGV